ncbi:MAG: hypothetical protein AAF656_08360, partial [Planctomycetota bacterium]
VRLPRLPQGELGAAHAPQPTRRDARKPFNADDRAALECAAGPFAQVLTTLVSDRGDEDWSDEGWPHVDGGYDDDDEGWPDEGKPRDDDRHAADWWKNGDDAPY